MMKSSVLQLAIADLGIELDAREAGISLVLPECYSSFESHNSAVQRLRLDVRDHAPRTADCWQSLFYHEETWQLWRDTAGHDVYVAPRFSSPSRQVTVAADFGSGDVVGEFGATKRGVYPLRDIDVMLYANWLARTGDLILHACGIDDEGVGFAFVGPAGAGKSTLASALAMPPIKVLGEDSLIVRRTEGRFLLYGTPWHTNPERCAPGGVELEKLFFLERVNGLGVRPIGHLAGIQRILQNSFIPYYNRGGVEHIMSNMESLAERVPFFTLDYRQGTDVLSLIRNA